VYQFLANQSCINWRFYNSDVNYIDGVRVSQINLHTILGRRPPLSDGGSPSPVIGATTTLKFATPLH